MMGSLTTAERRLQALVERYGLESFERICNSLIDHGEAWMRSEISEDPRRHLFLGGLFRGRRRQHDVLLLPLQRACAGRRDHRRPVRLGQAGGRADQRDLRRHVGGELHRHPAEHLREGRAAQRRHVPADQGHRHAGHGGQSDLPGAERRRQHRGPAAHHRLHSRRDGQGDAGADRRQRGRHRLQPADGRHAPGDRRVLDALPARRLRLGRTAGPRRQQLAGLRARQHNPRHPDRGVREPLPAARARILAAARLRRRRPVPRRPRRHAASSR